LCQVMVIAWVYFFVTLPAVVPPLAHFGPPLNPNPSPRSTGLGPVYYPFFAPPPPPGPSGSSGCPPPCRGGCARRAPSSVVGASTDRRPPPVGQSGPREARPPIRFPIRFRCAPLPAPLPWVCPLHQTFPFQIPMGRGFGGRDDGSNLAEFPHQSPIESKVMNTGAGKTATGWLPPRRLPAVAPSPLSRGGVPVGRHKALLSPLDTKIPPNCHHTCPYPLAAPVRGSAETARAGGPSHDPCNACPGWRHGPHSPHGGLNLSVFSKIYKLFFGKLSDQ